MKLKNISVWGYLTFSFLIVASILSAYFYDVYNGKEGVLLIFLLIALTPIIFVKKNNFNRTYGMLAITLSLIYLIGFGMSWDYIWGYDINGEYFFANKVLSEGYWNSSIADLYNSVVSITLLAPITSLITGINIIYVFKIYYYFLLAFIPIILLKSYEKLFEKKIYAELSVFFFIFLFTYFTEMLALARQIIAEYFLSLLIYSITIKKFNSILMIILLIGLSLSHYSTAFLMIPPLLLLTAWQYILKNNSKDIKIENLHVIIFCITTIIWYSSYGGGVPFNNLALILYRILNMISEIFNPQYSQGLGVILEPTTPMREIAKWINVISQGLISIGIINVIYTSIKHPHQAKKINEFYLISFAFYLYCIGGVIIPLFANQINVTRLYHFALFFLSPFFTLGGEILYEKSISILTNKKIVKSLKSKSSIASGLAVFLTIYFLFNSGLMLEIARDPQPPQWLDKLHAPAWSIQERIAVNWLTLYKEIDFKVYMGDFKFPLFLGFGKGKDVVVFKEEPSINYEWFEQILVYLGKETILRGEIQILYYGIGHLPRFEYIQLRETKLGKQLSDCNNIYVNTETLIYFCTLPKIQNIKSYVSNCCT